MMRDRARIRLARSVAATSCVLAIGSFSLAAGTGQMAFWWRSSAGVEAAIAMSFGVIVWLAISERPRDAAVWAMAVSIGAAIDAATLALVPLLIEGHPSLLLEARWVPADTPELGWLRVVGAMASIPGLFVPLSLGVMLLPDGSFVSRRWRPVAVAALVSIATLAITHGWWHRPTNSSRTEPSMTVVSGLVVLLAIATAMVGLVRRFRRSTGTRRLQLTWVVWGAAIAAAMVGCVHFVVPDINAFDGSFALIALAGALCWAMCWGIAVGCYPLYEIGVVISRSLVYASLAVLVAAVYVVVVVALGGFVGGSSIWLSVFVTAIVAVSFDRARARLQQWANRLVYGHRSTPYEILGDLTRRLAVAQGADEILQYLVAQLSEGTAAIRVTVWLDDRGALRPTAVAPGDCPTPVSVASMAELPGHVVPIEHEGVVLGYLTLEEDSTRMLSATDARLANDLARSAALVVHKHRLDRDLAAAATDIAESRRRMIDAQDLELRRLERELKSTVERDVEALAIRIGIAERVAASEGCGRLASLLAQLAAAAREAIDEIRSLAQGIAPPLLDGDGLVEAIRTLVSRAPLDTSVVVDVAHRLPADVERAVYFCVAEALTNASKHADGPLSVTIADRGGALTFTVADSGPGFETDGPVRGSGMHNMRDRLDALGGTLEVVSRPGGSTTVIGRLPVPADAGRMDLDRDDRWGRAPSRRRAAPLDDSGQPDLWDRHRQGDDRGSTGKRECAASLW